MPKNITFGQGDYISYSRAELEAMGLIENHNMYLGSAFRFCVNCNRHGYVIAMSHRGQSDCFEVCVECQTHNREKPIIMEIFNAKGN